MDTCLQGHSSPYFKYGAEVGQGLQVVDVDDNWSQDIVQCVTQTLQETTAVQNTYMEIHVHSTLAMLEVGRKKSNPDI